MSSISQGRRYNDTHRDTTSLDWLSICKQTEKDHNNPSSGCTDRSRSVSGEGADNNNPPPGSGAAKTPELSRSDQPKCTAETATEILSRFGLDKNDLGELSAYSEDQITPENLKCILMKISINKKKRAAEKSSESQSTINLKSDLHQTPIKSNKVIDCGDFGSSVTKKETGKASTDERRGKTLVETHKPSEDQLQRCVLKGKSRDLDSRTSRKSEISEQNKTVSPKHKPEEPKLCKPLPPKQQESTSKSSKASKPGHKRSNSKERKTQVKEKKHPEEKNPEVQTELKHKQQGQEKPVMQTKFKGSSCKNEPSHAIISAKQKPDEPKSCKRLPPKQPESTSKCSDPSKPEQKSSNNKESKTQIKETIVPGQNKRLPEKNNPEVQTELKRGQQGQDKPVMQTKFKGSSCKNEPSHAIIRDCKGISPESFPHYCSICNKKSCDLQAWCSHMKTTDHREKCKTLYPDLFCEQQFYRIDAIWRRCQETAKHKSDLRRRNASRSRSQERSHRRGFSIRSPCRRNASRSRSRSHGRQFRRGSGSRSPCRRNASRSRSRSHGRQFRRGSGSRSPCRRNVSRSRSRSHGRQFRRGSGSRSPCRRNASRSRSRSHGRQFRRGSGSRSPCRRNASRSRSRSHGRQYRRGSGSRSPCRRNASRSRSRSYGRQFRRGSSSRSHSPYRQRRKSRSRSTSTSYSSSSEDRKDRRRSPPRSSYSYRHTLRSRSRSPRYKKSTSSFLLDLFLPPGSTSSQEPPLSSFQQRGGPPLLGPPFLGPPPLSQDHLLSPGTPSSILSPPLCSSQDRGGPSREVMAAGQEKVGPSFLGPPPVGPPVVGPPPLSQDHFLPSGSNSSQGPPLCSFQERCRPHLPGPHLLSWNNLLTPGTTSSLPCPPPVSWVSRPSSFSRKEEELFSPGTPSEKQLSPKSSSKNSPSPSRSGEKQTSGETSVPQDESGAETLVKKLLQSSAVQSLSKQMDVESLVKTLTPIFLDEFNKLTSTPGSSEAPQTAGFPPNHEPPVTSTEQKTATKMESEPSNKIEALNVKEKPKNETELKCLLVTPPENKPASIEKPAPVISSEDLTVGEKIEKCFDPKLIWPVEFTDSISEPELLITNLPNYFDGCYTEDDLVDLLRPFGFEKSSNIYVIPQKQLAIAFMPHVKGLKEALTQSRSGMFFKGSKLCLQACRIVTCWKPGKSTSLGLYKALMRCLKHNMTDNGEGTICIHHISPSETRDLRTALRKIGSVRNFLPLLNKVFIEFESKHDADRLGVWYSFLKPGRKHTVERLKMFVATSIALPPKLPAQALPDASDAVATARIPIANGVIKDCAVPPFWVTMSTAPYMFPTMSPWFDIPAFQTVKEVSDIKKALPQASQFSTIMLTGFPQSIRRQSVVAQMVSGYFTKGYSESVNVLSLQRRAFVFFPCWDSCQGFLEGYLTSKPSGKDFVLKVHLVLEDMRPGDTEETMYRNLMRWSNAHVSEPESLSQRLICVTFSDITLSVIQGFLMAVGSIAPFVNYLVLTDRIYIEMCDSSSAAQVLDLLMSNLQSEKEKKKKMSDCDQKKEEGFRRKRQNVYLFRIENVRLVQRQPPAGGAVSGMAKASDKIQPAGVQVEAEACEQLTQLTQTEAAEAEDVGTDSAEDRTENESYTQQRQTPADESTKEEGEQEQELIDFVTDQEDKQEEKQKTAGKESEMRGGSAAKEDETTSGDDAMTEGENKGEEEEKEASTKPEEVGAETADGSDRSSPGLDQSVNAAASGDLEQMEQEVTSLRKRGRPRKKPRKTPVTKSAGGKPESPEENREEEDKSLPGTPLDPSSSALLRDVKTETEDEAAEVLDQPVNAAAAGNLEETVQTEQEVTSKRKGGRPRKKHRKTPVKKSAGGKPESPEENREEEDKSLPGAPLDPSSSALLRDVKTETEDEAAEAAGNLQEMEKTEQEVISTKKRGRPRKKPRKTPVRKSAGGKPESPEENREEETKPETDAEGPEGQNLDGRLEEEEEDEGRCRAAGEGLEDETSVLDQPVNAAAAGNLEEMEDTEQEVTSLRKRGRPRKKPRKTPVTKSAGGKPESPKENREEEDKSLPGAPLDPSSSALLRDVKTETEDEAAEVLDQPVNAAAAGNLEETVQTEQEVTSKRKGGRPRKKHRKTPVKKSAGGKPESPEENREEEDKSLPGALLDSSSSALLRDVKTETEDEAAEGPDKLNLDGRLEEEDEEEEEVACKKRRTSLWTAADFILPPFNPDISCGEEFTARKLGYFCSLCSVFYVLKSNEEDTHCCSRNHYDNLLKHSQMKEEQPSPPPKTKTRRSQ